MSSQLNTLRMTVLELRKGIKMAEAGQSDDNIMRPDGTVAAPIDRRPEWKAERARMLNHFVNSIMDTMSEEEKHRRARGTLIESHYYAPDHKIISMYEEHGGLWTEIMYEKYRFKEDKVQEYARGSSEPEDNRDKVEPKLEETEEVIDRIAIADVGISEEARREKEETRKNLYS